MTPSFLIMAVLEYTPVLVALFAAPAIARPQPNPPATAAPRVQQFTCDESAIDWHTPDAFEAAIAEAKASNRIILIKGVSFGIDAAGAKCATEGTW